MYITCKKGLNKIPCVFISRIGNPKWCFYWELPIVPKKIGYEPIKDSHCKKGKIELSKSPHLINISDNKLPLPISYI
jgi:hypothetical protein